MHLGRLAIFFGVLALVGLLAALSERSNKMKARLRALRKRERE